MTDLRTGFSFLEMAVATAILAVVITLAMGLFYDTDRSVGDCMTMNDVATQADQAKEVILHELRNGGRYLLNAAAPGTSVTCYPCLGYDYANGEPEYGAPRMLRFTYTEANDGVDNDRDGLIDEGDLELLRDSDGDGTPDQVLAIVARNVDESVAITLPSGSTSVQAGDTELRFDFTLQGRLPRDGAIHRQLRQLRIGIRND